VLVRWEGVDRRLCGCRAPVQIGSSYSYPSLRELQTRWHTPGTGVPCLKTSYCVFVFVFACRAIARSAYYERCQRQRPDAEGGGRALYDSDGDGAVLSRSFCAVHSAERGRGVVGCALDVPGSSFSFLYLFRCFFAAFLCIVFIVIVQHVIFISHLNFNYISTATVTYIL